MEQRAEHLKTVFPVETRKKGRQRVEQHAEHLESRKTSRRHAEVHVVLLTSKRNLRRMEVG